MRLDLLRHHWYVLVPVTQPGDKSVNYPHKKKDIYFLIYLLIITSSFTIKKQKIVNGDVIYAPVLP